MSLDTSARLLPAPLPYSSQAGRGEIPAPKPAEDLLGHPDAPRLPEDEATLLACTAFVLLFIVIMVFVAASGGL